jgi:hypothetical protein
LRRVLTQFERPVLNPIEHVLAVFRIRRGVAPGSLFNSFVVAPLDGGVAF